MNPGSSPLSAAQADSPKNIYIPMSPGPHHFDFPGFSATLPARKGSSASLCHRPSRLSDVTPPPINRNLKPNRKCEFLTVKFGLILKRWFSFLFNCQFWLPISHRVRIVNCFFQRQWLMLTVSGLVFHSKANTSWFEEQWDHWWAAI